ncbi:MAG TPA: SdrD B-like domain-containing protein, partial [Gemmataceae bacterium]|nr:SdrD B-like domain-containing protein [Gemmataceae bacterium]
GGGGVNAGGPTTNISNSEFLDNFAGTGGGLLVGGTTFTGLGLTFADNTSSGNGGAIELQSAGAGAPQSFLTNSTLTGNKALNANGGTRGGAIDMSLATSGDLVLINDTLNGNYAGTGGGLFWAGKTKGSAIFENTIVAGNFAAVGPDVDNPAGFLTDLGGNLIGNTGGSIGFIKGGTSLFGVDPLLGPLQNNGGPTVGGSGDTMTLETEALLPGSPAIGKGLNSFTTGTDERGLLRQFIALNVGTDAGAFETRAVTPTVASTVPGSGDVNPYGVFFVPANFPSGGKLQPGDLLVSNFNNAGNVQGTGTTIVKITPGGQPTTFFTSQALGLDDALAVLQAGFVVVGNVPNVDGMGTPGPGSLQFIDKNGNLVKTLTDANLLNGPWGLAVNDQGSSVQLFVSNVNSGTITRINLSIQNGTITVTGMTQIASGFTHKTDPNAFVIGPAGLAYDAIHNVLYVASQADDAIYKIVNAGTTTTDGGTGTKVVNDPQHLHGPLGLVLTPGGNLIVANSDGVNADPNQPSELVEYTFSNGNINFGGQFSVDPANGGAFGLGLRTTAQGGVKLAAVNDNATTISTWDFEPGSVTGQVFQDRNGDGQFNGADAGLPGVAVNLLGPGGAVLATTTTDANGNYSFFNVAAGNYQVGVTPPNGSVLTTKTAGVTVGSTAATAAPLGLYGFAALTGTTLTITGTAGADTVVISLGANDTVNFDGGTYSVSAAAVSIINYVGNGGADTVYVIDPAAGDVANLFPNSGVLQGTGYTVNVSGVNTLVVVGGATDRAYLHDSPGNDVFLATPAYAILHGPGYFNQVNGFGVVLAAAGAGGTDYAYLYDSPGNDVFVGTPTYAYLYGTGFFNQANGFTAVIGFSTAGGTDYAYLYDSAGNDVFVGTPGYAYLYGSGFFNQANGFTAVIGFSTAGGTDYAYLYDSPGNDVFVGTPAYSYLYGSGFFNQADGFKAVTANSSAGGFDQAFLYGSSGNDVFVGMPTTSYLYGSGFWNQVNGFQAVHATGGGGHDVAYLYGAPSGDDSLSAQGNAAALSGPGYSLGVDSFAQVVASVTGNGKHHKQVGAIDYIFTAMGDFS